MDAPVCIPTYSVLVFPFTIEYDVSCGLVIYDLYYVEVSSLHTHLVESFYHERIWDF